QISGLPIPSLELSLGFSEESEESTFVERRAKREAGFTEQRSPPSSVSGRITGRLTLRPT
ncbi:hypothetical protein LINGRAHAP2_LOCUS12869, partial [Linum grandiflorum]